MFCEQNKKQAEISACFLFTEFLRNVSPKILDLFGISLILIGYLPYRTILSSSFRPF